jgi:hypothetical protein
LNQRDREQNLLPVVMVVMQGTAGDVKSYFGLEEALIITSLSAPEGRILFLSCKIKETLKRFLIIRS